MLASADGTEYFCCQTSLIPSLLRSIPEIDSTEITERTIHKLAILRCGWRRRPAGQVRDGRQKRTGEQSRRFIVRSPHGERQLEIPRPPLPTTGSRCRVSSAGA